MASLFQGSPQTATSYAKTTSETPQWMQDAIYNQIQWAQNIANRPYEQYSLPTVAELSPLQKQAYGMVQQNAGGWQPSMAGAAAGAQRYSTLGTAQDLQSGQGAYLAPQTIGQNLQGSQQMWQQAGQTAMDAPNRYQPYLAAAGQSAADTVGSYMSPYQEGVLDVIAKQGARNLKENLLPGVSDSFIRAGQFGSSRMGEFGSRAVRDTQEAILNQQAQLLNQGYGQAMGAAQTDLSRQGQLASTAGQLTAQEAQTLGNLGQMQSGAATAQQQLGLGALQNVQGATASDYDRQMRAIAQSAAIAQQQQQMGLADAAALESAGTAQRNQMQQQLDAARAQYEAQRLYPQQQLDWLNTQIRGMAPITPQTQTQLGSSTGQTYSPSPLSQLATAYYAGKAFGQ